MLAKSNAEVVVTLPSEREISFTRVFERPRHLLFEAWTKPEHVRQWWGCHGSSVTTCEIDLRVGGAWHLVMSMPDGSDHPFKGIYREIVPDQRLVYSECYDVPQIGSPEWLTTVTFEDVEGGTRLTHTILHRSREARDGHLQAGMEAGAIQTLGRLDEHAAGMEKPGVKG
jgi:uncharacterized protein YndB with AHSA1/START domain